MSQSISGANGSSISGGMQRVAGGMHDAVEAAGQAVSKTHDGVGEVREVIRAQPITAALIVFALGYLFGRLGSLIPSIRRG